MSETERMVHELGQILEGLLSPSEGARKPSEKRLNDIIESNASEGLYGLALLGQGAAAYPIEARILSLILLRRLPFQPVGNPTLQSSSPNAPFDQLSEPARGRIEASLFSGLEEENDGRLRKSLADVVGKWVEESGKRGRPLPALPPLLLRLTTSASPLHRLTPFQLLLTAPTLLSSPAASSLASSIYSPARGITPQQVAQVIMAGMDDPVMDVKVAAVKCLEAVLGEEWEGGKEVGRGLVGKAIELLIATASSKPLFLSISQPLLSLSYSSPNLFTSHLPTLLPFLLSVCLPPATLSLPPFLLPQTFTAIPPASPPQIEAGESELVEEAENERFEAALEFFLTVLENQKKGVSKKALAQGGSCAGAMGMVLGRMVEGLRKYQGEEGDEGLKSWLEQDDLGDDDDIYPVIPEEALERIAAMLPAGEFLGALFLFIQSMVASDDWRARHAGLMALCQVGEGTAETMVTQMDAILGLVLPLAADPHPRVQYAAMHCLGQLATDFEEDFHRNQSAAILQTILGCLASPHARVASHAAAALVNFADVASDEEVRPYLDQIVHGLLKLLDTNVIFVQEQALTSIASIAITAGKDFAKYYSAIMPMLISLLQRAPDKEIRLLKGRGMECAGLIGMAVGKETFQPDAITVANLMAQIQGSIVDDDDPQQSYLTTTWAKLASCLKQDFSPYMDHVMPPLFESASQKVQLKIMDSESMEDEAEGYELFSLSDDEQLGIKTSALEEKATAFEVLAIYVVEMGVAFAPWAEQALHLCLKDLNFLFETRVREASANMIPALLEISKEMGSLAPAEIIFKTFNESFLREDDMAFLSLLYAKFLECMQLIASPLPAPLRKSFDDAAEFQLNGILQSRRKRQQESGKWKAYERDEETERDAEEEMVLDEMSKALHAVDPAHPMLVNVPTVRNLALPKSETEDWEDDDEE